MSDTPEALPAYPEEPGMPDVNPEENEPLDAATLAAHYEKDDVDVRALARFAAGIGVASLVAMGVLWLMMRAWTGLPLPFIPQIEPAAVDAPAAPGPGLDAAPERTLERVLARDSERLNAYGWVDRENGVVHMPIEEAMRLLLENGVPARDGEVPNFSLGDAFRMDSTGGTRPVRGVSANEEARDVAADEDEDEAGDE